MRFRGKILALVCLQFLITFNHHDVECKQHQGGRKGGQRGRAFRKGGMKPPPHQSAGRGYGMLKKDDYFTQLSGKDKDQFPRLHKFKERIGPQFHRPSHIPQTRGRDFNQHGFKSKHTYRNPYLHMITSDADFEWSRESGWHSAVTEDEYHVTTDTELPEFTETVEPTTPEPENRKAWKSQGSFTGDIRIACLSENPEQNCRHGTVQVYHKEFGKWGTICGDTWSSGSAKVVCNYLNFRKGKALKLKKKKIPQDILYDAHYLNQLQCSGDEWTLTDCQGDKIRRNHTCKTKSLAGVKCSGYIRKKTNSECVMSQMKCNVGDRCIEPSYICDGMSDCPWGSDEENCNGANCKKDQYWCGPSGGGCIANEFMCDGESDCIDESDEKDCEQFLSSFNKILQKKSRSKKYAVEWENVNAYLCAQKCKQEVDFVCTSFDIHTTSGLCLLYSFTVSRDLKRSKRWEHYESEEREDCSADDKYRCKDGACLRKNQVCDSISDCADGKDEKECEPLKLRLRGGSGLFEGHVEVSKGLRYGLVCDTHWTLQEATVVCRQLGYSRGASKALLGGSFSVSDRDYMLNNVRCTGDETNLEECLHDGWSKSKCMDDHEASVVCITDETTTPFITTTPRTLPTSIETTVAPTTGRICGVKPSENSVVVPQARVVGGIGVNPHEWPWQAAIWLPWTYWCGGALIDPCWVLTAAHCFERLYPLKHYTIRLGDHVTGADDGTEQEFKIAELIKLDYNSSTKENDIALIRLEPKNGQCSVLNDAVRLVCIPKSDSQFDQKTTCHVTGWGKTSAKATRSYTPILQEAAIPLISDKACKRDSEYSDLLKESMMCAGHISGGIDSCQGDSGGPLSCQESQDGLYYVWGVVSWGNGCARPKAPGVYARVGNFIKWIEESTGIDF